jgi:hypothetical protein
MNPEPRLLRLGPEQVFTGLGRRACDGAVLELDFSPNNPEPTLARLLELHDLNLAERRAEREVAWFLKRCLARILEEGLTLIVEKDVFYLAPNQIEASQVRYRQFCTPPSEPGPFSP